MLSSSAAEGKLKLASDHCLVTCVTAAYDETSAPRAAGEEKCSCHSSYGPKCFTRQTTANSSFSLVE
jgi:hypothetical protein